jgi:hypothetical protein
MTRSSGDVVDLDGEGAWRSGSDVVELDGEGGVEEWRRHGGAGRGGAWKSEGDSREGKHGAAASGVRRWREIALRKGRG